MKTYGLIGYPLKHSFSKKYFTEKFSVEGITGSVYENFEMEDLGPLKARLPYNIEGLNVTIPYKEKILLFLDTTTQIVKNTGACNCINITDGSWEGHNTDVPAFTISFKSFLKTYNKKALILGTGGASKAVAYALKELEIEYLFVSRSKMGKGMINYDMLTKGIIETHQVIINTTPVGTFPNEDECPSIPYDCLTDNHYLYDLVYNPRETLFLKKGKEKGAQIKNGLEMLELQAEKSWQIWNERYTSAG